MTGMSGSAQITRPNRSFAKLLAVGLAIITLVFISLSGYSLYQNRTHEEQYVFATANNLANLYAQSIGDIINKIDLMLLEVKLDVEANLANGAPQKATIDQIISSHLANVPEMQSIRITDHKGDIVYGITEPEGSGKNICDRDYYTLLHDDPKAGLIISKPIISRIHGKWLLVFSRRVNRADGSFFGIVMGTVTLEYFNKLLAQVDIGPHGGISLRDSEMGIIARHPAPKDISTIIGNKTLSPELRKLFEAGQPSGTFFTPTSWDNVAKVVSYRKVGDYPLYINIGIAAADYLPRSRNEAIKIVALSALFLVVVTSFAWVLYRTISTEKRRVEETLRGSEEKYRNLVDNLENAAVYQITGDLEGNRQFIYMSRAVERLNEVTPEEVLADPTVIYRQILPEYHDMLRIQEEEAIRNSGVMRVEVQNRLPSGRLRWFEFTVSPRRSEDGRMIWDGIEVDITERKNAEAELRTAKAAAEAANIAKTEFLANMSHEIRTPINGVVGNAQLLRFTELTTEQSNLLTCIEADARNLVSIINDVLDISKIEAGKLELEQDAFNIRSCMSDLIGPLEPRIKAKGISLQIDIDNTLPQYLLGDQLRLKQIMRNLLGNAIKFTETGTITVQAGVLDRSDDNVLVRFSVSDTGIGIGPETLAKLFAPFSQADASVTRKFGGTGLGLSICSRLAELMGGQIAANSTEGKGSTFHVRLPFKVADQSSVAEEPARSLSWSQRVSRPLRILLVDDSQSNLIMTSKLLRHIGHHVITSDNGLDALKKWETNSYDLILMDIQMPEMDGEEAMRTIRDQEQKSGAHIPIIALTAHALSEQRDHLLCSGFDGYVSKPIELSLLLAEMERLLSS